jgi:hypothetical protein
VSRATYEVPTGAAVASAAATTAKTILGVKAHANSGIQVLNWNISFDGVTASAAPIFVELCYSTWATNSPGTASTSATVTQRSGRALTAGFTGGYNWTTEPTVLTMIRDYNCDPNKGVYEFTFPLGDEPDSALAEGYAIRCTVPSGGAAVNYRANLTVCRN